MSDRCLRFLVCEDIVRLYKEVLDMKIDGFPTLWFPPLTYYKEGGEIDTDAMAEALEGIYPYSRGVLVPGSTGDGWVLSEDKQEMLVRYFLKGFDFGRFSMMIGALKPTADETIAAIRKWCSIICEEAGMTDTESADPAEAMAALDVKAFVFCVPAGVCDREVQIREMSRILDLGLPMAFYQLPLVTGVTVEPEVIAELADRYDNLIMAKDSGGKDEMAKSGLLRDRLMLLRGAEGDPSDMILGESQIYDGLLLSTVNCFAREHSELMNGKRSYSGYGDVISEVFAAATDPVSNAFSDSVRAICYAKKYGKDAADITQWCYNGEKLPADLVQKAIDSLQIWT